MTVAASLAAIHCYPLKSACGLTLAEAELCDTGLRDDRRWMLVDPEGRFITQREAPRLALLRTRLDAERLELSAPDLARLSIAARDHAAPLRVRIWRDDCAAFDAGDSVAQALTRWLGRPCRLVRFDPRQQRLSERAWTGDVAAANAFSDGFPLLVIGAASLVDLNRRMGRELPMNRFRPNLVLAGIEPYDEDRIDELQIGAVRLKLVKPCTRCVITTTSQERGERDGEEPLQTLRGYRQDARLRGLVFGQNAIILAGVGARLRVGSPLTIRWRPR